MGKRSRYLGYMKKIGAGSKKENIKMSIKGRIKVMKQKLEKEEK